MTRRQAARTAASLLCLALCVRWGAGAGARAGVCRKERAANGTVVLHDYMMFLYRTLSALLPADTRAAGGGAGFANTVTSLVDQGKDLPSWESGQRYIFDLSSLVRREELVEAELRILRKPPTDLLTALTTGGNLYNIRLYACSPEGTPDRQLLDSRTVEVLDGGLPRWEVFDVWSSMRARLRSPADPPQACFHLLVSSELTGEAADPLLLGLGRLARLPQEKALLVAFLHADTTGGFFSQVLVKMQTDGGVLGPQKSTKPAPKRRKKKGSHRRRGLSKRSFAGTERRGAAGGKAGRRRSRCSLKPLHVNFRDLGWDDWIIAPLEYEAHYCDGLCDFPLRAHLEPTNHAVIQTLMNSIDADISPPSCCVPTKLSPISILYIDSDSNVVYRQYEDMVVESCGCR